jgi:hypothetical protein
VKSHRPGFAILALTAALAAFGMPSAARAGSCSSDGCPMDIRGHDSAGRRFSFDVAYQYVGEDQMWMGSGPASAADVASQQHVEQYNRSNTTIFTARGQALNWLGFSASMPWIDRSHAHIAEHHTGFFLPESWHYQGLGDLALVSSIAPWAGESAGGGPVTFQLGVKLPTGKTDVGSVQYGLFVSPEPSVQPGSGSTDLLGSAQVRRSVPIRTLQGESADMPLTLSGTMRWNGRGTNDYRMGNEGSLNLVAGYPMLPAVSFLAQVNSRWMQADEPGPADVQHSAGGYELVGAPGLRARVAPGLAAYVYYRFRIYQHLNNLQVVSPYYFTFGTVYSFGG